MSSIWKCTNPQNLTKHHFSPPMRLQHAWTCFVSLPIMEGISGWILSHHSWPWNLFPCSGPRGAPQFSLYLDMYWYLVFPDLCLNVTANAGILSPAVSLRELLEKCRFSFLDKSLCILAQDSLTVSALICPLLCSSLHPPSSSIPLDTLVPNQYSIFRPSFLQWLFPWPNPEWSDAHDAAGWEFSWFQVFWLFGKVWISVGNLINKGLYFFFLPKDLET